MTCKKQKILQSRLPISKSNIIHSAVKVIVWKALGIDISYMTQFWGVS